MSDSPATTPHGEVIDGAYRVDAALGAGGEGAVLRATRLADGQVGALKRLHLHRRADAEARTRFEREARALNGLEHPNIIRMLDFGFDDQGPYLVTELLSGRTLDALLREGPLPPEVALELGIQIAAGLGHAHAEGVVHRDIKPENVLINEAPGRGLCAKLLDFGLARFFDSERWADAESLTREGAVLGTPLYMPAEQSLGQRRVRRAHAEVAPPPRAPARRRGEPPVVDDRVQRERAVADLAVRQVESDREPRAILRRRLVAFGPEHAHEQRQARGRETTSARSESPAATSASVTAFHAAGWSSTA